MDVKSKPKRDYRLLCVFLVSDGVAKVCQDAGWGLFKIEKKMYNIRILLTMNGMKMPL